MHEGKESDELIQKQPVIKMKKGGILENVDILAGIYKRSFREW